MLDRDAFVEEWRRLMGQQVPLTENNVLTYVNRREEMRRLTTVQVAGEFRRGERCATLPSEASDLLNEIDWCLANSSQGMRSRAALAAAAMALSGGRAMTSEEKARLRELADRYRNAQHEEGRVDSLARLERFVASLLSFRLSPNADVPTPALDS
ncbi:hypothetical protein AB4Y45_33700 [Paraburkholderia sp. EG287A]|uniref:hypothetical protein n=1 Tax=Paraburkholderia sp. EG287A TaxID=3237012 RepID=UPI0034D1C92E